MENVQIKGWIPTDLNNKFREIITKKFPKYGKAQLSRVLIQAIELYVRTNNTQQHNTRRVKVPKQRLLE